MSPFGSASGTNPLDAIAGEPPRGRTRVRRSRRSAIVQRTMTNTCTHLDQIRVVERPETIEGCEECLAIGGRWVHLRMCQSCGRVGCCDSSPNRHATGHARASGHAVLRSVEPGEAWSWCVIDELAFVVDERDAAR